MNLVVALGDSIIGRHRPSTIVTELVAAFEAREAEVAIAVEEVPFLRFSFTASSNRQVLAKSSTL